MNEKEGKKLSKKMKIVVPLVLLGLLIIGLALTNSGENDPPDVIDLRELTKDMNKQQKAEAICKYQNKKFLQGCINCDEINISKDEMFNCEIECSISFYSSIPLLEKICWGDIRYFNKHDLIIGRCDYRKNECTYFSFDTKKHYMI